MKMTTNQMPRRRRMHKKYNEQMMAKPFSCPEGKWIGAHERRLGSAKNGKNFNRNSTPAPKGECWNPNV